MTSAVPSDLAPLTHSRSQHRRTVEGKLCAAAFVQDGSVYTGCTSTPDPNGVSGRPWCYVEPQLLEESTAWGFCAPAVDYDSLRQKVESATVAKVQDGQVYIQRLEMAEAAAKDTLNMFRTRCT